MFLVEGDTGRWRTTLYGRLPGLLSATCSCPAYGMCSHMLAAKAIEEGLEAGEAVAL